MSLNQRIPRNLEDSSRILGLSPVELAACALCYSFVSPILRGVPFAALLSLTTSLAIGITMLVLNRTYPPNHGLLTILQLFRPRVTLVAPFGLEEKNERNRQKTR
jgi:hypothetical protein